MFKVRPCHVCDIIVLIRVVHKNSVPDELVVVAWAIPIAIIVARENILWRYEYPPVVGA
jgi:hypothetical protein